MKNNTTNEIIAAALTITVINDGQFRYPVWTEEMKKWITANGEITASNYDQFCSDVDCLGEAEVGTPGSTEMIALCEELTDAGSDYQTLG